MNNFGVQQRRKNVFFHELHQPLKAIFGLGWPQRSNMRLIRGCWSTLEFSCNLKNASFDELISVLASGGLRGRNWIYFVCWKRPQNAFFKFSNFQFLASSDLRGRGAILKISNIHTPWVLAWKLKWNISRHLQTLCCKSLPPFVIFRANIATTTFFIIRFKMAKRWRINTTLFSQVGG